MATKRSCFVALRVNSLLSVCPCENVNAVQVSPPSSEYSGVIVTVVDTRSLLLLNS